MNTDSVDGKWSGRVFLTALKRWLFKAIYQGNPHLREREGVRGQNRVQHYAVYEVVDYDIAQECEEKMREIVCKGF